MRAGRRSAAINLTGLGDPVNPAPTDELAQREAADHDGLFRQADRSRPTEEIFLLVA